MNTRLWKRFGGKLAWAVFEFVVGAIVVAALIGIFAGMVMAGAWVVEAVFGDLNFGKWVGGAVLAIVAIWVVAEVGTLYVKTEAEVEAEDAKIMAILAGNHNGDNP